MKKLALATFAAVSATSFLASGAWAQNAKFEAIIDKVTVNVTADNETPSDSTTTQRMTTVKLPGNKALLLGVSSQIAISTKTKVVGKQGGGGSAQASGDVAACAAVVPAGTDPATVGNDDCAEPGEITFSSRLQDLDAVLGGVLVDCTFDVAVDPDTGIGEGGFESDDCNFTNEEISLLLDTTAAHHFNFVWQAPATGEYDVYLLVSADASAETEDLAPQDDETANTAEANVVVGPNVLTIEEVRPAKEGVTIEFQ